MKLIVGLGNPGKEYANTRHNIGFMTLDAFLGDQVTWKNKMTGSYTEQIIHGEKVIFLKPLTYMNLSGDCVAPFLNFYKLTNRDLLIIQDDLDLPYLDYRLKFKSSSGGHNGIKSIQSALGTDEIPRLKIGIAHNRDMDTKDYVLGHFSKEDLSAFEEKSKTYNQIIDLFIDKGIDECMHLYNRKSS